jgi:integrase
LGLIAARGLTAADQHELIFVAPGGGPLRYNNWLRRVWQPAVVAAGVPALRFHDLRRTAATAMVAAGVDVRTAQAGLGHADPRVTLAIYAQVVSDPDRHAAHQLQAMLMEPPTDGGNESRLGSH